MNIQQIRNATLRITISGKTFLIDPWLAAKGTMGCFADIPGHPFTLLDPVKEQIPMPIFDLPMAISDVLADVDAYLITHIHPDHIDMAADGTVGALLDHAKPIYVQNEADAAVFQRSGFSDVRVLSADGSAFHGVKITKAPARHGVIQPCGDACGLVFEAADEQTLYVAGDTVWYEGVRQTLATYKPPIIVLNTCAAEIIENGRLIMGDEDVEAVARTMPESKIIPTHMDNVAHASITRHEMRGLLARRGIENYQMPADGEVLAF